MNLKVASLEKTSKTNKDQKIGTLKRLLHNVLLTKSQRKGIQLYQKGYVKENGLNKRKVRSLKKTYNVHFNHGEWTCNCPDYQYRDHACKHIHATQIHSKYTTHSVPELTFTEMIELEKQLYPHPISSIKAKIQDMKIIIPEMMEVN